MSKHSQFPTPIQNIALNLTFAVMREERYNRTYDEYMAIAATLPPLNVLTFKINELLAQLHKCHGCNGVFLPELCSACSATTALSSPLVAARAVLPAKRRLPASRNSLDQA